MLQTAEKKKTEQRCLTAALVFNALFLALALLLCRVGFESNDDLTLAAFVDGQMAVPTAHIPYINIVLGVLLKGIYTVLGRGAAWHTLCQMLLLYLSFAAMSYVLCRRLGVPGGLVASAALLLFAFGLPRRGGGRDGRIPRWGGVLLLAFYVVYMARVVR